MKLICSFFVVVSLIVLSGCGRKEQTAIKNYSLATEPLVLEPSQDQSAEARKHHAEWCPVGATEDQKKGWEQ